MAVPVRADLEVQIFDNQRRLITGLGRFWEDKKIKLEGLSRGLPQPEHLLEEAVQRLDSETDRLDLSLKNRLEQNAERLDGLHARLRHPGDVIAFTGDRLLQTLERLDLAILAKLYDNLRRFKGLDTGIRLPNSILRIFQTSQDWLVAQSHLLESLSYKGVLNRGFALVRDGSGKPVMSAENSTAGGRIEIEFADGKRGAIWNDGDEKNNKSKKLDKDKTRLKKDASSTDGKQGSLL